MKKAAIFLISFVSLFVILLIVNITVSNVTSTDGIRLSLLQTRLHDLQKEDTLLEQKVLALSSFTKIASQAATIGFIPSKTELTVSSPVGQSLAYQP